MRGGAFRSPFGLPLAVFLSVFLALTVTAPGGALTWNQAGYAGAWDTVTTNWTGDSTTFSAGDDVSFLTFATLGGGSHYTHQTVTVDAGGVAPNSILFRPAEINYLHLAGGDISATAGGITVDSTWSARQAQLHFDRAASYSFTGDVIVKEGCHAYYKPTVAGTYNLGTGVIRVQDLTNMSGSTSINYEPTATNTTLNNDIRAESGVCTFNWGNYPKFAGDLLLDSDIYFNSVGGGNEYFDWLGNVVLSGDRKITGGVRDIGRSGGLWFTGQFQGPTHTLTLDFQNSPNVGMRATMDSGAWNIANLVLDHGTGDGAGGNTPSLLVHTANPTDDHFATLRGNGGRITLQNGAQLYLRRGSIQGSDVEGGPGQSRILVDQANAAYDVRIVTSPLHLGTTSNRVNLLRMYGASLPAAGTFQGDLVVHTGGVMRLETLYGHLVRHDGGNLRLEGGGRLDAVWSSTAFWSAGYRVGTGAQQILLGDGSAATQERITLSGAGSSDNGVFAFGVNSSNIIDDGNVILRYEQNADATKCFNIGWTDLASVQALTYAANTIAYAFRGGSAGTEFAPYATAGRWLGVIGRTTGTVFTATRPARLVTAGWVRFCNSNHGSYSGHRGTPGQVVVDAGGTFDLEAAGLVEAGEVVVTNGGSLSGIGTFGCVQGVTVHDGSIAPGTGVGTLTLGTNLTLTSASVLDFQLSLPGFTGEGTNDLLVINGDLTLDGTLSITPVGNRVRPGEYTLITYTGSLTDHGLDAAPYAVNTDTPNEVRVTVTPAGTVITIQ